MSEQEKTPNGDPVYRYDESKENEFKLAIGDGDNIQQISDHIEKHVGKIAMVYHEIVSDAVHIDVHWVKPSKKFPFHTLVTSGMSDFPMTVPEGLEENKYAEVCILLPETWKLEFDEAKMKEVFSDENNYWPIRWLKIIARFPHKYNTWLGWGHTLPNGAGAEPFAPHTKLGCMMLMPSISLPPEFYELNTKDGRNVRFFCLMPLYKEEMDLKLDKGSDALTDKFDEAGINDIVRIDRPNTCAKKGFLGLW